MQKRMCTQLLCILRGEGSFRLKSSAKYSEKSAALLYFFVSSVKNTFLGEKFFHLSRTCTVKYIDLIFLFFFYTENKRFHSSFSTSLRKSYMSNFCTAPWKVFNKTSLLLCQLDSHSLIRGVLIQSCSTGAKNFTKCVFYHVQFSGVRGRSQTTWTRFRTFFTPPSPLVNRHEHFEDTP